MSENSSPLCIVVQNPPCRHLVTVPLEDPLSLGCASMQARPSDVAQEVRLWPARTRILPSVLLFVLVVTGSHQCAMASVGEVIASADVVSFDMPGCPFVRMRNEPCFGKGVAFKKVDIVGFQPALTEKTGMTSAPSVWIKGMCFADRLCGFCRVAQHDGANQRIVASCVHKNMRCVMVMISPHLTIMRAARHRMPGATYFQHYFSCPVKFLF